MVSAKHAIPMLGMFHTQQVSQPWHYLYRSLVASPHLLPNLMERVMILHPMQLFESIAGYVYPLTLNVPGGVGDDEDFDCLNVASAASVAAFGVFAAVAVASLSMMTLLLGV